MMPVDLMYSTTNQPDATTSALVFYWADEEEAERCLPLCPVNDEAPTKQAK